ncbi:MAG TPA: hypothetical protein VG389_28990 [Myxococcota bacterium]|jgi:hypothetical protein|nr:hypothetical protein [Myxococcota bacterium]
MRSTPTGVARAAAAVLFVGLFGGAAVARAQSLNVDFGLPADAPSDTYGAAGLPGVWNSIEGDPNAPSAYALVGLDGAPTAVTLYQYGGTYLLSAADPSVSGDDAALLNDALITYDASLESCLFVNGLEPGTYEVTVYAWMPAAPSVLSRVRHDLSATTVDVGGAWTGAHVEGITYARHLLDIPSDGFMGSHSGIVPGASAALGAALNGFQIRKVDCGVGACTDSGVTGTDAAAAAGTDAAPLGSDAGTVPGSDAIAGGPAERSGCGCQVGAGGAVAVPRAFAGLVAGAFAFAAAAVAARRRRGACLPRGR